MREKRQQITLDLASGIFKILKAKAAKEGQAPEEFISDLLTKGVHRALEETLIGKGGSDDRSPHF